MNIPVEVSARHVHLSKNDLEQLFGIGYELNKLKQLSQPSDFACQETIEIKIGSKTFQKVRVVSPLRKQTQIEVSLTDAFSAGVDLPIRLSGDLRGSGQAVLIGPKGEVKLSEGVIIAQRHLHCATDEAKDLGIKTGDFISIRVNAQRPVIFENVVVRVNDNYKLCLHLDTDEGNAAGINKIDKGEIIKR